MAEEYFTPSRTDLPERRFDLDWLRVLAFGLLIFYHTGMLYVADWDYHVKSQYLSHNLQTFMLLVNPWRMAILWMISGIAIRFILAKVSLGRFIVLRSYRLLLPLLFAILVVIPPQLYYQMTQNGDLSMSYWEFYQHFFDLNDPIFEKYSPGIWHHIDVNHLWYLRELWRYSLYLIFILPILNSSALTRFTDWLSKSNGYLATTLLVLPIFAIQLSLDDTKDALGFLFLLYGYALGWHSKLWKRLKDNRIRLLGISLLLYLLFALFYNFVWLNVSDDTSPTLLLIGMAIYSLDRLVWVMTILALSFHFLNNNSTKLAYLNEAVYPYYILHQTLIVTLGFELTKSQLGAVLEPVTILLATFSGCAIAFELIRRVDWLRPLFGLKVHNSYSKIVQWIYRTVVTILLIAFALEILI